MSTSFDGLVSGMNTTDLIRQLMSIERAPQDRLRARKSLAQTEIKALQGLNTKLVGLRNAARQLARPSSWTAMSAKSSATSVATVTASTGSFPGVLTFDVTSLARAGGMASTGTVTSTSAVVSSGSLLLATGTKAIGIESVAGDATLALGGHTIRVTQESSAAAWTGTAPLAGTLTIDGTNDTLSVRIDGVDTNVTLTHGVNLAATDVLADIEAQFGGALTARLADDGSLVLATTDEGSAATIRVNNAGTANATLNLTGGGAVVSGTDAVIDVDGTETTLTDLRAGGTATLASGTGGSIDMVLSGGIRSGTVKATNVSTGDGTLSEVVTAINGAGAGINAAAVQVSTGQYRLQLSATKAGIAGDIAVAVDAFSGGLGQLASTSTAADAVVTVGSGAGAYTITSGTNTLTDLFPGVTVELAGTGETTITVEADAKGLAAKVKATVDQMNAVFAEIKELTGYDAETKTAGLLMGNFAIRTVHSNLVTAVGGAVSTSSLVSSIAGVSTTREGTLTFDESKFLAAFADDATEVGKLFRQGGTASSSRVSFHSATDKTLEGTYDVVITQAAERAQVTGTVLGTPITAAETIDVRVGGATGKTVTYAATAGESLESIAAGLSAQMAGASLRMVATVEGGALVVRSTEYGSSTSFEIRTSTTAAGQSGIASAADVWERHAGVNVQGTINGVSASGVGRLLAAPPTDDTLAGLTLRVTATPDEVALSTDFGTFDYVRGVGQRIASLADASSDSVSGTITAAIDGRTSRITQLDRDIQAWDRRLDIREQSLRRRFVAMEQALGQAQAQSNWLAGQISQLQAISSFNRNR